MKFEIIFTALLAAVQAFNNCKKNNFEVCPQTNNFDVVFPSIVDCVLPESEPFFFKTAAKFFNDVMKFSNREIQQVSADAITFFNTTYGLDFSKTPPHKNGSRYLAEVDATLLEFEMNPALHYSVTFNEWTVNGVRESYCVDTRGGGFLALFGSDTVLYGTYGGSSDKGVPIRANERIIYGFYNIPLCPQSPMVIQYQSASPIRMDTLDGFAIFNLDLFNRELGAGLAQGVFRVTPLGDGNIHYSVRNVITFPPHPGLQKAVHCNRDKDEHKTCAT